MLVWLYCSIHCLFLAVDYMFYADRRQSGIQARAQFAVTSSSVQSGQTMLTVGDQPSCFNFTIYVLVRLYIICMYVSYVSNMYRCYCMTAYAWVCWLHPHYNIYVHVQIGTNVVLVCIYICICSCPYMCVGSGM